MSNADEMAFPELNSTETGLGSDGQQHSMHYSSGGLTKREYFAIRMAAAMLAHDQFGADLAKEAVDAADELIAQLACAQQSGDSHG